MHYHSSVHRYIHTYIHTLTHTLRVRQNQFTALALAEGVSHRPQQQKYLNSLSLSLSLSLLFTLSLVSSHFLFLLLSHLVFSSSLCRTDEGAA